jgi:HNH endonuclease
LVTHRLDTSRLGHQRLALEREALRQAAERCTSLVGVIRKMKLEETNSNVRRVRRALDAYQIDTEHFVRTAWRKPDPRPSRLTTHSAILGRRPTGTARVGGERLRRALLATGVPERCRECGIDGQWRGRPLTLEVDHINGDWRDNRPENLRLLCPNCHATTDTYCRRKEPIH